MAKKKTFSVKLGTGFRTLMIFLLILFLLAFLLRFDAVAGAVAKVTPWEPEQIQSFAGHVILAALGVAFLAAGVAFASITGVGVAFAVIGLVLLVIEAVNLYNALAPGKQLKGLKTLNV